MTAAALTRRRSLVLALALTAAFVIMLLVLANATAEPTANPTPTPTSPRAVPPVGALNPDHPTPTPLEDTPEVQALRHASAAITWAHLQMTCDFPEAKTWLHQEILETSSWCRSPGSFGDGIGDAGPDAFEPQEIIHNDDGTVDVVVCQIAQPRSRFEIRTHEPAPRGLSSEFLRSIRRLVATGDSYQLVPGPVSPVREECEPREPITTQVFVDWQHTPLFTTFTAEGHR